MSKAPAGRIRPIVVVNFDRYNPPHKAVNKEIRDGGPLKWLRWETIGHRDKDILDLPPSQRFLWWVLCDLAGQQQRTPDGLRVIRMTPEHLAREADLPMSDVRAALAHLWKRERIRYTVQGGAKVAARAAQGGARVALDHPAGWREGGEPPPAGWPRTYVPTNERTSRAREDGSLKRSEDAKTRMDLVAAAREIEERTGLNVVAAVARDR